MNFNMKTKIYFIRRLKNSINDKWRKNWDNSLKNSWKISWEKRLKRLKKLFWNISGGKVEEKWRRKIIVKIIGWKVNEGVKGA